MAQNIPQPKLTRASGRFYASAMEVRLTPDQEAFIRRAIQAGRFVRAEDAVSEALSLWEERERRRAEFLASLNDAEAAIARGEGRVITENSMRELASEVKQRGRERLAAEQSKSR
jgi:putative addiction module CopG family antidote